MGNQAGESDIARRVRVLQAEGRSAPLPAWATWMMDLGAFVASNQSSNRRWIGISLPDRRYASLFIAAGFVSSIEHGAAVSVDELIDDLSPGEFVSWLDANGELRAGEIAEIRPRSVMLRRRDHGGFEVGAREKFRSHCQTVRRLRHGEEPFTGGKSLSARLEFLAVAMQAQNPSMLICPSESAAIVGVVSEFEKELSAELLECGGATGRLIDLVRPHGLLPRGERTHVSLVPSTADYDRTTELPEPQLLIFDGPQGFDRLRDSLTAHTSIVLLDRWAPRSVYSASSLMTERSLQYIDGTDVQLPTPPGAVELLAWEYE